MARALLILLGLLAVTWFEFEVYPGHTYLQGETQLLVPMLERLDTPGFLSRDLVASNPVFAYTIYDEITESLHVGARLNFERALAAQQLLFRFAAIVGIFLLARALKVAAPAAVMLSAAVNAITHLASPEAFVTNPEAVPAGFALPLVLLAAGLIVNRMPLLAGLAAGLALLYDPITAAPFWFLFLVAWAADPSLRRFLRPVWLALVIFSLLLGNLVQLQAGLGDGQQITARMSEAMVQLIRFRTPWVWVTTWPGRGIQSYAFLLVASVWALALIWKHVSQIAKWVVVGLLASGFFSLAAAMILLANRAQFAAEMMPARNLAFTVVIAALLFGAVSFYAAQERRWRTSAAWTVLVIATILNAQVLDLLRGRVDVAHRNQPAAKVRELAQWAEQSTWGSSLFQFPDAGKGEDPGRFRALSRRALWADWRSGEIADYSDQAGHEWWSRWQAGMSRPYSLAGLRQMLRLPIDYYVLERTHALAGVKPAFQNSRYVVYDAQDLRESRSLENAH